MHVVKRDGEVVQFDSNKIKDAILKAANAVSVFFESTHLDKVVVNVVEEITDRFGESSIILNVENIHDIVEKHLMRESQYAEVAKSYIVFRALKRQKEGEDRKKLSFLKSLTVKKKNNTSVAFNPKKLKDSIHRHSFSLKVDESLVFQEAVKNLYNDMKSEDIDKSLIMGATVLIEQDPAYSCLASRLFRQRLSKEVFGKSTESYTDEWDKTYRASLSNSITAGVEAKVYDSRLLDFDLAYLACYLDLTRDEFLKYISIQTLYERYFAKINGKRIEMPQVFWMRVAMGLSFNETNKNEAAIKFYNVMSQLLYIPSTPTLFHSGLSSPQLSSCYLTSVDDDLKNIFQSFSDNAQLSKWSGGIGNDWTNVRATGSNIKSTMVESQGVIPFLKIANDTTVAINRSGKRRGATAAYLETWHLDIEDFLDLRKNTGDERRRTPDMNTVNWIPDLFMKRVQEDGVWTLFSPEEVPDLHHIYGKKFDEAYVKYEQKAAEGGIKRFKIVKAQKLYRKMLTMLFETGHAWMCFKDPSNIRSPQDHVGVVHSSNLCTEITLNTKPTKRHPDGTINELGEVATCNIGSLNIARHMYPTINGWQVDWDILRESTETAIRILDNVIDINFYPIPEARNANFKHRPVGLGCMGYQDSLFLADIRYEESDDFADTLQEFISYHAIKASATLAIERGTYETYKGSKWDRGIFPIDTIALLEQERGMPVEVDRVTRQDWDWLRNYVRTHGMRNSNVMAIAPTATICNIAGLIGPCGEAIFSNLYGKENMSGGFTVINEYLVDELKKEGLWDKEMIDSIKFHNGSVQKIDRIPLRIRMKYKTVWEIDQKRSIDLTALRGKWIDQSQSHNIFFASRSGNRLAELYMYAWGKGLKTTYYLRTLGVSGVEKSTLDAKYGMTQKREVVEEIPALKVCSINDPTCEACQ